MGVISYDVNIAGTQLLLFCFGFLDAIHYSRASFLFLLVVVLFIEGKGSITPTAGLVYAAAPSLEGVAPRINGTGRFM